MIAKILRKSKSFAGVMYNTLKTQNGKAELLHAANFNLSSLAGITGTPNTGVYLDYLNYLADQRPDINYRQFHAVISCKGRELGKEQLLEAAKIYIDRMGYGDQPYLVFFHRDTDNNHVHIVTSRVRMNGSLVPDNKERDRSVSIIRDINRQFGIAEEPGLKERAEQDIKSALSWKFPYDNNLVDILSGMGYRMQKDPKRDGEWTVFSDKEFCGRIKQDQIEACKQAYKNGVSVRINAKLPNDKKPEIFKRKQIIFNKLTEYASKGYSLDEIKSLDELRRGMGIELVSSESVDKEGKSHVRYAVIDHQGKTVYKGSDVYPFETLTRSDVFRKGADHFYDLTNQILTEEGRYCGWKKYVSRMQALGYTLHMGKGNVAYATVAGGNGQFHLPKDTVIALQYNQRVLNVRNMEIHSYEEARCLAAINRVKVDDILPEKYADENTAERNRIRGELASVLNNFTGEELKQKLSDMGVAAVILDKKIFFYHPQGGLYSDEQVSCPFKRNEMAEVVPTLDVNRLNLRYQEWDDYLNEKTVTYPERSPETENRHKSGKDGDGHDTDAGRSSRSRARDYDRDERSGRSASPEMGALLHPVSLAGLLQSFAQIMGKLSRGGGGGRSRKRKRNDDKDDDI